MEDTPAPILVGCQALEQFLLLAKTAKGSAVVELIRHATEANGVYVFRELLDCESVQEAKTGPHSSSVKLLEIFAYSTYQDYKSEAASLPKLSDAQLTKLKYLTLVSLASQYRTISYSMLLEKLDITNLRELEDLIIDAIYAGVVQGKLDQKNERLEVESFIGRDIKIEELSDMAEKLDNWCSNCMQVLQTVEGEMSRANRTKMNHSQRKEEKEAELKQLKDTLKVASSLEDVRPPPSQSSKDPLKTTAKKGLRGSAGGTKSGKKTDNH